LLCSVALALDGSVIAQRESLEEKSHAARLTVFIEEILKEKNMSVGDLDAIAVGKGPGSYTGLRIGVSTAKGLCYGANLPLIAVNTLNIMFNQVITHASSEIQEILGNPNAFLCPMIDARRMEVFTCLYDHQGVEIEPVAARIIDENTYQYHLAEHIVVFFGSGMEKCRELLSHPNAVFVPDVYPNSSSLAMLAEKRYHHRLFENVAYFEPFYLKDFIATTSKKGLMI